MAYKKVEKGKIILMIKNLTIFRASGPETYSSQKYLLPYKITFF